MKITRTRSNINDTRKEVAAEQKINSFIFPRAANQFITVMARTNNKKVHEELNVKFSREELEYLLSQF